MEERVTLSERLKGSMMTAQWHHPACREIGNPCQQPGWNNPPHAPVPVPLSLCPSQAEGLGGDSGFWHRLPVHFVTVKYIKCLGCSYPATAWCCTLHSSLIVVSYFVGMHY